MSEERPGKIVILNIPYATPPEERALVEPFGPVYSFHYPANHMGGFRGFCFVELDEQQVEAAISGIHGVELHHRCLRCERTVDKPRKPWL